MTVPLRIAYFDCATGAAGDMILGALLHAGAPVARVQRVLRTLPVRGYRLAATAVKKHGIAATHAQVRLAHRHHDHVGIREIRRILRLLPASLRDRADRVFDALAREEARIHSIPKPQVHFHEVGAVDAIVDVVGSLAALELLAIDEVRVSPFPLSHGTVRCEHGVLPVPAPATLALLRGWPLVPTDLTGELVTPTGAALLTTLAGTPAPPPAMTLRAVGYGAGTRDLPDRPNVLRVLIGEAEPRVRAGSPPAGRIWQVEANLDDTTGEVVGWAMERAFAAGALDAWATPVTMKKGRPGLLLSALVAEPELLAVESVLLRETTTFGVRRHPVERSVLTRTRVPVRTPYGVVRVKLGYLGVEVLAAHPEYEDCRRHAIRHSVPLRQVAEAAREALRATRRR